jgi:OOP family OmpA-OmpF porin
MKKSLLGSMQALTMASILLVPMGAFAEQPKATDLVGKVYGGIHAMHIETDNDRLMTADPKSSIDNGNGFGGEIGYRWLPSTEFRFSYSQFNTNSRHDGFPEPDGSAMSADLLYFPTEKNFYFLTGVNNLDIDNSQISGNLGAGYRHYLNDRMAVYFETKAHYQFSGHYDELTGQVGFVYFFGGKERAIAKSPAAKPSVAMVVLDTDKDGIEDNRDRCANTPMTDKVDGYGCTLYIDDKVSVKLLVSFDKSEAVVKSQYSNEIKAMADFLKANPEMMITIEGHASSTGPDAYNKVLSQKRADAIVEILSTEYNVDPSRLKAIGYGESRLFNKENTEKAHTENRRIMAIVEVIKHEAVKR